MEISRKPRMLRSIFLASQIWTILGGGLEHDALRKINQKSQDLMVRFRERSFARSRCSTKTCRGRMKIAPAQMSTKTDSASPWLASAA